MEKKQKKVKVAFDLDGVIVGKPPLIPSWLVERLVKLKKNKQGLLLHNNELAYRFPKNKIEQLIRRLSHTSFLRPPIKKNLEFIKRLAKTKDIELYIVSGRYGFLKDKTLRWLKKHNLLNIFKSVFINLDNEQPHVFKERIIKKLKVDTFIDDDLPLVKFLEKRNLNCRLYCFGKNPSKKEDNFIIVDLSKIFKI